MCLLFNPKFESLSCFYPAKLILKMYDFLII